MGYNTNMMVVVPSPSGFCEICAHINLCKVYSTCIFSLHKRELNYLRNKIAASSFTKYFIVRNNEESFYDDYNEPYCISEIEDCIKALKIDVKNSQNRRINWALALLESVKENKCEEMKVLFYGT